MRTLEDQLREYGEFRAEAQAPITVGEMDALVGQIRQETRSRRRGWLVGVAVGIGVLLVGVATKLVVGGPLSDVVDSVLTVPTTTPSSPTTVPADNQTSEGDAQSLAFSRTGSSPWFDKFGNGDAVWFAGHLYASDYRNQLYRTSDGFQWSEAGLLDPSRGGLELASGPMGLLASSGWDATGEGCLSTDCSFQAHTSSDGVEWNTEDIPGPTSVGRHSGNGLFQFQGGGQAVGPAGYLIMKLISMPPAQKHWPHVWWSQDGRSWTKQEIPEEIITGPNYDKHSWQPVAIDDGFLVLADLGEDNNGEHSGSEVWKTTDGSTWDLLGVYPQMERLEVWNGTVVAVGPGVRELETGRILIPDTAAKGLDLTFTEFGLFGLSTADAQATGVQELLFSTNGSTWTREPLDAPVFPSEPTTFDMLGAGDGFAVLGKWYDLYWWTAPLP